MYLALNESRRSTIREISEAYGISRNHLMKVVQRLAVLGYVDSTRGVGGGLSLGRPADDIRLGRVVMDMEPDMALVECMRPDGQCAISSACRLAGALDRALAAFIDTLNQSTLADLVRPGDAKRLRMRLHIEPLGTSEKDAAA